MTTTPEQLSGMDASFLALESAELPMHVIGVLLLNPAGGEGWSVARLRETLSERLHLMPPFNRKLASLPLPVDRPFWDYVEVDIDDHLHCTRLAPPGDLHALGELVGEIAAQRLDRTKPLWELHVVEGLADSRVGLLAKVHHSTMYGVAGADFIAQLLDLDPAPREVEPPAGPVGAAAPAPLGQAARGFANAVRWPLSVGKVAWHLGNNAAGLVGGLTRVVRRHGRAALPFTAPRTVISGEPTERRLATFAALSLDRVKEVKDAQDATVNDVVLAVVALALRDYLAARDALPDRALVASCPVNAGEGVSAGTNELAAMLVPLPMDLTDPGELLAAVVQATRTSKEFTTSAGAQTFARIADVTPAAAISLVTWLSRSLGLAAVQPPMQNLVVSNVMGPPIPLYLAGALVDAIYPMGPLLMGCGMNVTVLSNMDRLDVGVMACPDIVEDAWEIAELLPAVLDRF